MRKASPVVETWMAFDETSFLEFEKLSGFGTR